MRTPCAKKAKPFQSEFAFLIFAFVVVTINCGRGAPTQAVYKKYAFSSIDCGLSKNAEKRSSKFIRESSLQNEQIWRKCSAAEIYFHFYVLWLDLKMLKK